MGLDIVCTNLDKYEEKHFHISYIGFTNMRKYFVLHYGNDLYDRYEEIIRLSLNGKVGNDESFYDEIGDLNICICHSDCDGELTSNECNKLKKVLFIDEEKIRNHENYKNNPEYAEKMINTMYEFKELVEYCAEYKNSKLEFW